MEYYILILGTLGVWRITHLLSVENGPWNLMSQLRRIAGNGFLGKLLGCFYCLSLWTAAPVGLFLGNTWTEKLLLWLAMSAGVIFLERMTNREGNTGSANRTIAGDEMNTVSQQDDAARSFTIHTLPNAPVNSHRTVDTLQN